MSARASEALRRAPAGPPSGWPVLELIRARSSCRAYLDRPIDSEARRLLTEFLAGQTRGPFGSAARFDLIAATSDDPQALAGLGTYGVIRDPAAFIVGAVGASPHDLEDFGYLLEEAVLYATRLGLGTCWLGGTLTRSTFVARLGGLDEDETMPAAVAVGYPAGAAARHPHDGDAGGRRLPMSALFFDGRFGDPIGGARPDGVETLLEAVRLAPSASNKQPWRIVRAARDWHFYLQRTEGYGKGSALFSALGLADIQRVDMGIAMSHFELAAREIGLHGAWESVEPELGIPSGDVEYTATWRTLDAGSPRPGELP